MTQGRILLKGATISIGLARATATSSTANFMPAFKLPKILLDALAKVGLHKPEPASVTSDLSSSDASELCCDGGVHIFYRGVSDDRLYKSADRLWREVKYFRQNGLKVFCKQCRRRLF